MRELLSLSRGALSARSKFAKCLGVPTYDVSYLIARGRAQLQAPPPHAFREEARN